MYFQTRRRKAIDLLNNYVWSQEFEEIKPILLNVLETKTSAAEMLIDILLKD